MLLMRGSSDCASTAYAVLFLCLCVFMQMLGTSMTLWALDLDMDPTEAPLLDGCSLPTFLFDARPSHATAPVALSTQSLLYFLGAHGLFRPPNLLA